MARLSWSSRKKKLSQHKTQYRGRFAPSPTGPLHFGSLVAAVGSFLDARHHHGIWLVRMEDLDKPRCVPGAADDILRTLDVFGLHSDEPVIYQSQRTVAYEEALRQLKHSDDVYPCCCTRKEISDSATHGIEGPVYPGTCRKGIPAGREGRAWRVLTDDAALTFDDALQGSITQHLESEIGDFVVKRADGLFAYQLAVVVDDALQKISHIVRGADLLNSTPRQIHLQKLLVLSTPHYMHLPIAVNEAGEKLSKQTLAQAVNIAQPVSELWHALSFLRQKPPHELIDENLEAVWEWARQNWRPENLIGLRALPAVTDEFEHRGNE
ncbi:MAG: tRNA glutamyl-Q(34) synthetase GluQRS [Gammaproteobacteria bacterium]|nr:tRNA glutamyl-Q(34) synthetase GluQRS [Gammaproteobacteria bacterium]MBU1623934.1 tRNA glutamyl-Q(34) synthetase GluQRS [Gammaproteobacteria bacterium]MBU1982151.1 tRNA glutamyl-Q(34) synthetase GluQRS [Gammaproteobacteria bacterium]